jgi:hypothetical protein
MSALNATIKAKLIKELQFNPELDASAEITRIKLLKKEIIEQYGFEGLDLVFQESRYFNSPILPQKKYKQLFLLPDVDKSCPWKKYAHEDPSVIIDSIFKSIHHQLPRFLPDFKKKCKHVFAIMWSKKTWALGYCIEQPEPPYYKIFIGNPPNETPELSKSNLIELKWKLPQSLKEFYAIHDGFGHVSSLNNLVLPIAWLDSMSYLIDNSIRRWSAKIILDKEATAAFDKEVKENPLTFEPENMLRFFQYNIYPKDEKRLFFIDQCFYRKHDDNTQTILCKSSMFETANKNLTYKDKQWKIAGHEQTFYEFIDERFWKVINGNSIGE